MPNRESVSTIVPVQSAGSISLRTKSAPELVIDSFAGGGGASLGIAWATGRAPDIAINHDAAAIAMHAANHPSTKHVLEDVWSTDLAKLTKGKAVGLLWLSPDCFDLYD